MRKFKFTCLLAVVVAVGICSGIAGADVIYNTFAPGDTFINYAGPALFTGQMLASRFTVSGNDYLFDQLELAVGLSSGTNLLDVSLRADSAGVPGTIIESFSVSNAPQTYAGKLSIGSVAHPLLQNGLSYWVVMAPGASNTSGFWPQNEQISATVAWGPGSSWTVNSNGFANVYRVSGNLVPEPSSLLAMFAGLGSLGGILRRRRR